jgi:NADP-reducing hydrogenase subunit HndB
MPKLKIEDLARISDQVKRTTLLREGACRAKVNVHMGTCGIAAGARKIVDTLLKMIEEKNVSDVILTTSGCAGLCSREPMATVEIAGEAPIKYVDLTEEKIRRIFTDHVLGGHIVMDCALAMGHERTHM